MGVGTEGAVGPHKCLGAEVSLEEKEKEYQQNLVVEKLVMGQAEGSPRHRGEGSRALLIQRLQALAQGAGPGEGTAVGTPGFGRTCLRLWLLSLGRGEL